MASSGMALSKQDYGGVWEKDEASGGGVSWAAVFAGAFTMGALALILAVLGAGFGLSSVSPWGNDFAQASRVSAGAIIWLMLVQLIASSLGGYLAGRLRTKWVSLHTHEVYFRDTAHGFLAWALASVLVAMVATSGISSAVSTPGSAVSSVAGGASQAAASQAGASTQYLTDSLFRADQPKPDA